MPEQTAVQCHLELRPFLRGGAQGGIQRVGVDVLLQCAGDAEHPRVALGRRSKEHLGDVINFVP